MKENIVSHSGIVKNIDNGKVLVSIIARSACASCHIKGACTLSEVEEKIIEVDLVEDQNFSIGEEVIVEMKQTQGTWAVLLGYFFPFLLVILALIIFTALGLDQGLSGILSLLILVPYYIILYLSRSLLRKTFTYRLK